MGKVVSMIKSKSNLSKMSSLSRSTNSLTKVVSTLIRGKKGAASTEKVKTESKTESKEDENLLSAQVSQTDIEMTQNPSSSSSDDEGMRIKRLTLLSIVERMEEFSGDFDNIKNSKNYQNQITNPAERTNEQLTEIQHRALLRTQLQELLEKSEQADQDLGNFKSALEANQLRQKLSGTAIQA
jgi:hypothetical protein